MTIEVSGRLHCERLKSGGYRVTKQIRFKTSILPSKPLVIKDQAGMVILRHDTDGWLTVEPGYQWDGASFIVIDRKANMRAGLLHDSLYQEMRMGLLSMAYRVIADGMYRDMYLQDGDDVPPVAPESPRWKRALRSVGKVINNAAVSTIGALDYAGLRVGAASAARPQPEVESIELVFP